MLRYKLRTLLILLAVGPPMIVIAQAPNAKPRVAAPVVYEDTMLVVVSGDDVAAVIFKTNPTGRLVYDFRYEARDGTRLEGVNRPLFESRARDVESEKFIKAGTILLEWSVGAEDRGWIYYEPEKIRVHLAHAPDFADRVETDRFLGISRNVPKLDLQRFIKPSKP